MSHIIPDTNILLRNPNVITELTSKNYFVIIPMTVIDELDRLKMKTGDIAYKARTAIRQLDTQKSNPLVIFSAEYVDNPILNFKKGDGCIQSTALFYKQKGFDVIVLTEDAAMGLSLKALHIKSAKDINEIDKISDKNLKTIKRKSQDKSNEYVSFDNYSQHLVEKIQAKLGAEFEPKYNKSGVTFFGPRGRILKLVNTRSYLHVEFNVPVTTVDGLTVLTREEAREKKMGTCQWIYKGDSLMTVLELVDEAVSKY